MGRLGEAGACGAGLVQHIQHRVLTAAPERVPQPLIDQLKVGGKMVIPVGRTFQDLMVLTKTPEGVMKQTILPVRFVPMTGKPKS